MLAIAQHVPPLGQPGQDLLAVNQAARPEVPAVEMEQIERIKEKLVVTASLQRGLQARKAGHAILADADQLAIHHRSLHRQPTDSARDRRHARCPIEPVPGQQAHLAVLQGRDQAVAVELDLGKPFVALGRLLGESCKRIGRITK
jgi:hypothetical protein